MSSLIYEIIHSMQKHKIKLAHSHDDETRRKKKHDPKHSIGTVPEVRPPVGTDFVGLGIVLGGFGIVAVVVLWRGRQQGDGCRIAVVRE